MNQHEQLEHLVANIAFVCERLAQRAFDACRLGMDGVQAGQSLTNEELLWQGLNDLAAFGEMCECLRGQGGLSREAIDATKAELEAYFRYPFECVNYYLEQDWHEAATRTRQSE